MQALCPLQSAEAELVFLGANREGDELYVVGHDCDSRPFLGLSTGSQELQHSRGLGLQGPRGLGCGGVRGRFWKR